MLLITGTENGKVVDEKVILDDNNKLTSFGLKLVIIDVVFNACLFTLVSSIIRKLNKK